MKTLQLIILSSLISLVSCVQPSSVENKLDSSPQATCEMSSAAEALSDPQNINELTNFINALPKPLNLECFVKSLKRPLMINATSSTSSAQPANGIHSPRIFIFKGDLIISIVPDGEGSTMLEYSELMDDTRSIKGELIFPISSAITAASGFARIINGNRTSCSACHSGERLESTLNGTSVFSSVAIKPGASMDVSYYDIKYDHYLCDFNSMKTARCNVLKALFDEGDVHQTTFPAAMSTFQNSF